MRQKILNDGAFKLPPFILMGKVILLQAFLLITTSFTRAGSHNGIHKNKANCSKPVKRLLSGAPALSYTSPQIYTINQGITALTPTSSGVGAAAYNSAAVIIGSGLKTPAGVAVDAAGNVYVADKGNNAIKKYVSGAGSAVIIGSGFSAPDAVAVDGAGNVYVADHGNNTIKEIPFVGGSPVTLGSGFSGPTSVAVDAAGNIYVADLGNNEIKKIPSGNGAPITIGSGFSNATGVAVDAYGNVYVADQGNNAVKEILKGTTTPVSIGSGFDAPFGVSVDAAGNVYVADLGNNAIKEIPAGNGTPVTIGSGFNQATCATADASGNVYVADQGNNEVKKFVPIGGYYLSNALPAGLSFNGATGVISGTPTVLSPAINYTITAYNASGGTSAIVTINIVPPPPPTISYSSPQTYYVSFAISKLAPASSGVASPAYSTSPLTIGSGFNGPAGIAVDAAGNVYVTDNGNDAVKEIPAGNGTPVSIGSGFDDPFGVAVDAAGNVYVGDFANNAVKKIPAGGGATVSIGSGFHNPAGVAVDVAGNVYVADYGNSAVKEMPAGGGATVSIGSGFHNPTGVAVDAAGNVYVADYGNSAIKKIPAGGGVVVTLISGIVSAGVASDAAGNLYIANNVGGSIEMIPAGGSTPAVIASGFDSPAAVAVDVSGNLYEVSGVQFTATVTEIPPVGGYYLGTALPAGLSFNGTTGAITGTPTAVTTAKNYTITAYNPSGATPAKVNIKVLAATANANLASLKLNNVTLSPAFAATTTSYTASVANAISSTTVTETLADPTASVTVNGVGMVSGSTSAAIVLSAGPNIITTVVTAHDGTTTKTYTVTITRAPSSIATLSSLALVNLTLTPAFAAGTTSYTANAANATTFTTVTQTTTDPTATVTVNGIGMVSGSTSAQIPLIVGANTITTVVTAQDGTTSKTYTVTVTRAPSSIATLSALKISNGTLTPTFTSGTTSYTAAVSNTTVSIQITPTTTDNTATVKVNGTAVTSGSASGALSLNVGTNTIKTVITAQDGATTDTYTLTVTRAESSVSTLSDLQLSTGTLTPAFTSGTTSYTASVPNSTTSVNITPTSSDDGATININGEFTTTSGGMAGPISLNIGANVINNVVTSQDGTTTHIYTVTVTRAASSVATLSALKISSGTLTPVFASGTTAYTASVANTTASITVTLTTADVNASVKVNGTVVTSGKASGAIGLAVGANVISIVVLAQDGTTTQTYTVTVTRLPSSIATLSKLTVSTGALTPVFATGTTSYTDVAHSVSSIAFRAITTDPMATETINGTAVPEGTVSSYVPLNAGVNNISIVVTAQDGVTTDTYTIAVTRLPEVATLSKLTVSSGTLSPAFATGTTSYTDVAHSVSSIAFRATTTDPLATETINGTAVPEGTVSPYIPLNAGVNNISIVVTAQDGVTTDTYTIAVTRLPEVATLSKLTTSSGTLTPAFAAATTSYTDVAHSVSSIAFRATTTDALATETINGTAVPEGTVSPYTPLNVGVNTITIVVTAQDGVTKDTYTIAVTRLPNVATLSKLTVSSGTLTPAFATATTSYTDDVANTVSSIAFRATTTDASATETINGTAVPEGAVSYYVPLSVGLNTVNVIVTAQDGVTTETYTIAVTRAAPVVADAVYQPISVETTAETPRLEDDVVIVHQGVSPNGDGVDDFLQIDGILAFPDNRLMIMNRNGMLVYETKGYDNASRIFDGRSNKNGQMQLPGTYFYWLDYTINGINKHKAGFLVLKY
jgi:sugar lactone lactonase YvrE